MPARVGFDAVRSRTSPWRPPARAAARASASAFGASSRAEREEKLTFFRVESIETKRTGPDASYLPRRVSGRTRAAPLIPQKDRPSHLADALRSEVGRRRAHGVGKTNRRRGVRPRSDRG